jgi:hypothetical protein
MHQRPPRNLTGQVVIPPGPSILHGSFSSIYRGTWDSKEVNLRELPPTVSYVLWQVVVKVVQFPTESNGLEAIEKTMERVSILRLGKTFLDEPEIRVNKAS